MPGQALLPADLTVVVPCYNEVLNVRPMVDALSAALSAWRWEVVFVDDHSPDGTAQLVRDIALTDSRVRVIERIGRRGLSSAVIEGVLSSAAPIVAVMDGDLQHDESVLPRMAARIRDGEADLVVASRHVEGGDNAGLAGRWRHMLSDAGIRLAQTLLPCRLTDPMSGFFAVRRSVFAAAVPRLAGSGFKILLELALTVPRETRIEEMAATFRPRLAGESKLSPLVMLQFLGMLAERICGNWLPLRFIVFALVGLVGIVVNIGAMNGARLSGLSFEHAQLVGTICAIFANFQLNNRLTYHDRRLKGRRWWPGFLVFLLGCGLGNIANIGVAQMLFDANGYWTRSSAAGAVIGVVWNYAVASTLVWR
ncbi:dolichol-phosphate mannosyltransferase [Neoasaia chiangmaiensis NBRC 101099]|uniref:Dolichol monophosphate mannose synthase n=1 Tax=Neoasaia chiangmaiensis TaxID=320497 RepID=A0A1U9KNC5_9PROT|nr:glycosyltransferase family 2 protein [Neoasaia chiangmaiensis]AQS87293.1 dolichol monophosphate mannose synthase [Neoasaia chiangmaiensis]GBR38590.1 dolichol-phosphate mannosyltransferase [Neoasaia chiangmaiensis NBRC 101099]GEN15831.1 dolichol monophosphate mannose synthase [Neoasaia chiangmaiensis]